MKALPHVPIWARVPGTIALSLVGILTTSMLMGAADIGRDRGGDHGSDDETEMDGRGHGSDDEMEMDGGDHGSGDETDGRDH